MRSTLSSLILASAILAAVAFTPNSANAQSNTIVKVPFAFTVAGKNCPAGTYTVERGAMANTVKLTSMDAKRSFAWIAGPAEPAKDGSSVVLKFDAVGQAHVLRSVQAGALLTSRLDKNLIIPEQQPTEIVASR
jgi:hypothetical protein